ncbi:MAG: hypothetical protein FWE41_03030 [Coriobacteriia bacterium]|nr:hypothetical protein [Coriobacteriia bacterium]
MKKIAFLMVVILAFGALAGCATGGSTKTLTINDIQTDPFSFTGEIVITGVNAGFFHDDPQVFFVVDTAELLACKDLACGAFQLPVIYEGGGGLPELGDEVVITGSWGTYRVQGQGGIEDVDIFEITKIEVKRNIMNLLQ